MHCDDTSPHTFNLFVCICYGIALVCCLPMCNSGLCEFVNFLLGRICGNVIDYAHAQCVRNIGMGVVTCRG